MATPIKRRATSVTLRRDHNRARQSAVTAASEQTTAAVALETIPLMQRIPRAGSPTEVGDVVIAAAATAAACRLSSSATVRERRRCLSAEDRTPRTVTSRAPDAAVTSSRDRCNSSSNDSAETNRVQTETSSAVVNFLSPSSTCTTTTAAPSSTSSSPTRKARLYRIPNRTNRCRYFVRYISITNYPDQC